MKNKRMDRLRVMCIQPLLWLFFLVHFMHFSGTWFGVAPRMVTKKTHVRKRLDCVSRELKTFLNSIVNMVGGTYVYDHFSNTTIFNLIMNKIFIRAS